jgi:hypothetical protein
VHEEGVGQRGDDLGQGDGLAEAARCRADDHLRELGPPALLDEVAAVAGPLVVSKERRGQRREALVVEHPLEVVPAPAEAGLEQLLELAEPCDSVPLIRQHCCPGRHRHARPFR